LRLYLFIIQEIKSQFINNIFSL